MCYPEKAKLPFDRQSSTDIHPCVFSSEPGVSTLTLATRLEVGFFSSYPDKKQTKFFMLGEKLKFDGSVLTCYALGRPTHELRTLNLNQLCNMFA